MTGRLVASVQRRGRGRAADGGPRDATFLLHSAVSLAISRWNRQSVKMEFRIRQGKCVRSSLAEAEVIRNGSLVIYCHHVMEEGVSREMEGMEGIPDDGDLTGAAKSGRDEADGTARRRCCSSRSRVCDEALQTKIGKLRPAACIGLNSDPSHSTAREPLKAVLVRSDPYGHMYRSTTRSPPSRLSLVVSSYIYLVMTKQHSSEMNEFETSEPVPELIKLSPAIKSNQALLTSIVL